MSARKVGEMWLDPDSVNDKCEVRSVNGAVGRGSTFEDAYRDLYSRLMDIHTGPRVHRHDCAGNYVDSRHEHCNRSAIVCDGCREACRMCDACRATFGKCPDCGGIAHAGACDPKRDEREL